MAEDTGTRAFAVQRRDLLIGSVSIALAATPPAATAQISDDIRTYVLIHNGFAGGWVWAEVARQLRQAGHLVHAPTLTGLGERAHLAHPGIDLATHVQDVVGLFDCEELSDVTLVASSSGAMVAAGLAERMPERIARLVYIDTMEPEDGQSWMDLLGPEVSAPLLTAAEQFGEGWRVPRNDVAPPRWVPHPLRTVTDALTVSNPAAAGLPRSFILATNRPAGWFFGLGEVIDAFASRARTRGWDMHEIAADHLPQLSAPGRLVEIVTALPA